MRPIRWAPVVAAVLTLSACSATTDLSSESATTAPIVVPTPSLLPGQCLSQFSPTIDTAELIAVPCGDPHEARILSSHILDDGTYPGSDAVISQARTLCAPEAGNLMTGEQIAYLYPTNESWDLISDREVLCLAWTPPAPAQP